MNTMKVFRNLLIAFILLWIFVTIASEAFVRSSYRIIGDYQVHSNIGNVHIEESKATKVNGYFKGTITNITDRTIGKLYLVLECFSKNDVLLGTEYTVITNLEPKETREFQINYRYDDVDHVKLTTTEEEPDENGNFNFNLNLPKGDGYMDALTRLAVIAGLLAAFHAFLGFVSF